MLLQAQGATCLAESLLDALEWGAKEIILISDGAENHPTVGMHWLLESVKQSSWKPVLPKMVHLNPTLNPEHYQPHQLSHHLPTLGIREAETIPGLWILVLFASKVIHRQDLETYLKGAAQAYLQHV